MIPQLESFRKAFIHKSSGCLQVCDCGRVFFEDSEDDWDWEKGEFDRLIEDPEASRLDYPPSMISFGGSEYCESCTCWYEKAEKLISRLDRFDKELCSYFAFERIRKIKEANEAACMVVALQEIGPRALPKETKCRLLRKKYSASSDWSADPGEICAIHAQVDATHYLLRFGSNQGIVTNAEIWVDFEPIF